MWGDIKKRVTITIGERRQRSQSEKQQNLKSRGLSIRAGTQIEIKLRKIRYDISIDPGWCALGLWNICINTHTVVNATSGSLWTPPWRHLSWKRKTTSVAYIHDPLVMTLLSLSSFCSIFYKCYFDSFEVPWMQHATYQTFSLCLFLIILPLAFSPHPICGWRSVFLSAPRPCLPLLIRFFCPFLCLYSTYFLSSL